MLSFTSNPPVTLYGTLVFHTHYTTSVHTNVWGSTKEISSSQKEAQRGWKGDTATQGQVRAGNRSPWLPAQRSFQDTWAISFESYQRIVNVAHIISYFPLAAKRIFGNKGREIPSKERPVSFILCAWKEAFCRPRVWSNHWYFNHFNVCYANSLLIAQRLFPNHPTRWQG